MNQEYKQNGYFVIKGLFKKNELVSLNQVLTEFHQSWQRQNSEFYATKAVNSAYITAAEHLDEAKRNTLFKFIGCSKLMNIVADVLPHRPCFMNTQLFFNPVNPAQKNYWHRDPQYHLSVEAQKQALAGPDVVHFRIPLATEPGIELVPGSHKRWDSTEELDVRLESNHQKNHHNLSSGVTVELDAGDLLVFSANMIHRGLYGLNRLSFDILFCDPQPELVEFVNDECLPSLEVIKTLEDGSAFLNTLSLKGN